MRSPLSIIFSSLLLPALFLSLSACNISTPKPIAAPDPLRAETRVFLIPANFLDDFGIGWNIPPGGGSIQMGNSTFAQTLPSSVPGSLAGMQKPAEPLATILDAWQLSIFLRATKADIRTISYILPAQTYNPGERLKYGVTVPEFRDAPLYLEISAALHTLPQSDHNPSPIEMFDLTIHSLDPAIPDAAHGIIAPNISFPATFKLRKSGTLLIGGATITRNSTPYALFYLIRISRNSDPAPSPAETPTTMLFLSRPKIIIQREEEIHLFGRDYDKPASLPR